MSDNPATSGEPAVAEAAAAVAKLHLDEVTGEMISKTELKKRQKQREKEAAKKEKAAANPKPQAAAGNKSAEAAEKELTPNQVRVPCPFESGCPNFQSRPTDIDPPHSTSRFDHEPSMSFMPRARLTPTR
jgi:hypothetical protein